MRALAMGWALAFVVLAGCGPVTHSSSGGAGGNGGAGGMGGSAGGGIGGGGGHIQTPDGGTSIDPTMDALNCGIQDFMLRATPADLLIVLDGSGSMIDPPPGSAVSKWAQVTAAI